MEISARLGIFGLAAASAACAICFGGLARAQDAPAAEAHAAVAALPPGAIAGVVAGTAVGGLPGAIWADQNNDGYVDGYVRNGQYYAGPPQGYDPALRRVVSAVAGAAAGAVMRSEHGVDRAAIARDRAVDGREVYYREAPLPPPPPPPEPIVYSTEPPPPPPPPPPSPERDGGPCDGLSVLTLSPPLPSTQLLTLDNALFRRPGASLETVAEQLETELENHGYSNGFFCVAGGFALATKLERIQADKKPYPGDARYLTDPRGLLDLHDGFSLSRVFDALVNADPGRYRMLIFYVTDRPVRPTNQPPTAAILSLADNAPDELPPDFAELPYTSAHRVRVLVYEFARPALGAAPSVVRPTVPTRVHLQRAGLTGLQP